MKKKLAALLTKWAMKLNPEAAISAVVPIYEHYEAKAIGIGHEITKNELRKFKRENNEKSSRKALRMLIDETIKHNLSGIFNTAKDIVEVSVYRQGESTIVESRLNVYVKKADQDTEPEPEAETGGGESPMP
jgi:hypothetical protein